MRVLCERWSITQKVSPLDQPQLNPLHDCTGPLLKEAILQMVAEKQAEWDDFLDPVLFLFRTSTNPTTKFTPYSLMFNRTANLPSELGLFSVSYMTVMQEQQNSVKQLVLANMNAAYKQEKKNAKRKAHSMSPMTFKVSDPLFAAAEAPPLKKVKEESLFLSFPVETVLATEQSSSGDVKTELVYHLAETVN
uniref:Zgc:113436 n=1 Tax=Amphilophus citrinellus TaxID=61819 RepID=A0A3Q0RQX2_AMPCI